MHCVMTPEVFEFKGFVHEIGGPMNRTRIRMQEGVAEETTMIPPLIAYLESPASLANMSRIILQR